MNAESYLAQAIDPETGAIRPVSQILEAEHRAKFAARSAEILADQEAKAKRSKTQKLVDDTQRMYDEARHNDNRAQLPFWKNQLEKAKEQLASERAAEAKAKAFAADRR